MLLIASYIFIILGFVLSSRVKKHKKKDASIKIGTVVDITKRNEMYELVIRYSVDDGKTFLEGDVRSRKRTNIGENVIISIMEDESIELYKGNLRMLGLSVICWILGVFLCMILRLGG